MKTKTMTLYFPIVKRNEETKAIDGLEFVPKEYGIPDCVLFESEFCTDVQNVIDDAYKDYFQWESDRQYASFEKNGKDNEWETYADFATRVKPDGFKFEVNFASLYAYCIDKHVRTHYFRDTHGKYTKCDATIGTYARDLFEIFRDASGEDINDKTLSVLREQLRVWFGDVIDNDSDCKHWDTRRINIDVARQLVHDAGKVQTKMKKDFSNKQTTIGNWTEQALLKCFQRCFKMKPAPIETLVYVRK